MDITKKINEIALKFFEGKNTVFAERLRTNEANIRNYRTKIIPKVDFLIRLCNELEISFDWMFNDDGPMLRGDKQAGVVKEARAKYGNNPGLSPEQTIKDLREMIKAQQKTIDTLELLLHNKRGGDKEQETSSPNLDGAQQI